MTASRTIADVRQRPGLFVGDTGGSGVLNLVLELLANSYDQHVAGRCSRVAIELLADATIIVEDDGPGLAANLPPLHQVLTTMSTAPTVDGHRPHIHFGAGGAGLFVVNALSERFTICTVSRGIRTTASYTRGVVSEPVATMATAERAGTRITFRPDPQIFMHPRVPRAELARYLEDLSFLAPQLTLTTAIHGDAIAARGLAGRVAIEVPCALTDVATHAGTYETAKGPIDVEVAFAWRVGPSSDIASFVNLARTPLHGTHVDALLDAIRAFFEGPREAGLVAAVSVVLANVKWGRPDKDLLATAEVAKPVAVATRSALERWAEAHGVLVDAVRARTR